MSFLNPVNEPVLRFSSTDAGAPQINNNARVAGDIKTVLKACLVTGYGDKASAGWSIANEVNHVAEFVSPSVAMSDYRLGIDDTSATNTTWYYQYQDTVVALNKGVVSKSAGRINPNHVNNGWDLLVTDKGFLLLEHVFITSVNMIGTRVTYYGQLKLLKGDAANKNIAWLSFGGSSESLGATELFTAPYPAVTANISVGTSAVSAPAHLQLANIKYEYQNVVADSAHVSSPLYYASLSSIVAEQPAFTIGIIDPRISDFMSDTSDVLNNRQTLNIWPAKPQSGAGFVQLYTPILLTVYLDYWSY